MTQHSPSQVPPLANRSELPDVTAPDGSEIRLLIDHRHQARAASMVEVTLAAGQVSRPVWHQQVEEVWYVLQGRGEVWRCPPGTDPTLYAAVSVEPGDSLVIPTRWRFQFSASDAEDLRFLCFTVPPWPGDDEAQPAECGGLGPATVGKRKIHATCFLVAQGNFDAVEPQGNRVYDECGRPHRLLSGPGLECNPSL